MNDIFSNWKQRLQQARETYMKQNYAACRDFGCPAKRYSDKTANGLTNCIMDWLKYFGHYANRINTTGTMRKINGQMKWTKGTTRRGTADITAVLFGRHVAIEVKVGKDRMSDAQKAERDRVQRSGGIYITVKDMPQFCEWFWMFSSAEYAKECEADKQ
ncbi:MAG: hypothetical protein J7539_12735 [Niabella sp.]|nr:hypothetical protein [Niabella sp.]